MTETNTNFENEMLVDEDRLKVEESKLRFDDKVIAKIAKIAVNTVDGILAIKGTFFDSVTSVFNSSDEKTSGIDVEVGTKEAKVAMQIILEYGKNAPKIFDEIKRVVKQNVKDMTGLEVVTINVDIVDVMTRKEYLEKNRENSEEKSNQY
ncbi:MAG: Asp23/Gls24 family envelope stress response protein [Anaerococcus sp.]